MRAVPIFPASKVWKPLYSELNGLVPKCPKQRGSRLHSNSLPENVSEEPVTPLPRVGVQHTVQVLLGNGLGVYDVCHALNPLEALQGLEEDPPGCALATPTGPHHHEAVVQLGDLVELQHL